MDASSVGLMTFSAIIIGNPITRLAKSNHLPSDGNRVWAKQSVTASFLKHTCKRKKAYGFFPDMRDDQHRWKQMTWAIFSWMDLPGLQGGYKWRFFFFVCLGFFFVADKVWVRRAKLFHVSLPLSRRCSPVATRMRMRRGQNKQYCREVRPYHITWSETSVKAT